MSSTRVGTRVLRVWAAGLLGTASLLLLPLPPQVKKADGLRDVPAWAISLLPVIPPLVLVCVATIAGAAVAGHLGLRSRLAGDPQSRIAPELAIPAGLLLAGLFGAADALLAPWQQAHAGALASLAGQGTVGRGLAVALLYGALAEEVMARWGVMGTLMALVLWWHRRRHGAVPPAASARAAWVAIAASALLFAAGHLPALAQATGLAPLLVARTLVFNTLAGLLYGWLFWRRSLESAMLAHASTHIGFFMARTLQ